MDLSPRHSYRRVNISVINIPVVFLLRNVLYGNNVSRLILFTKANQSFYFTYNYPKTYRYVK